MKGSMILHHPKTKTESKTKTKTKTKTKWHKAAAQCTTAPRQLQRQR